MKRFFSAIKRFFLSKKGAITLGVLSLVYVLALTSIFITVGVSYNNPVAFAGKDFQSLRKQVLSKGEQKEPELILHSAYGQTFFTVPYQDEESTYQVCVSAEQRFSNYLGISTFRSFDDYGLMLGFSIYPFFDVINADGTSYLFALQAVIAEADGSPIRDKDMGLVLNFDVRYSASVDFKLLYEHNLDDVWGALSSEQVSKINGDSEEIIKDFANHIPGVIASFGVDCQRVLSGLSRSLNSIQYGAALLFLNVPISLMGSPILCLFLYVIFALYIQKKKARLLAHGELVEETPPEPSPTPTLRGPFAALCRSTPIRPIFGEWVIRGIGLGLLAIGSAFLSLIDKSILTGEIVNAYALFRNFTDMGAFLLVIALVSIIAETRKGLTRNSAIFFSLAITYYLSVTSLFFFVNNVITDVIAGITFSDLIASLLPGNIFFSIGLFGFLGFFLFEEPPTWLIHRKVFRLLCLIPLSISILSIVYSALLTFGLVTPNYWISSMFFVRDFDGHFIGILYIFILYFTRKYLSKNYGKDQADQLMQTPAVQLTKNTALCIAILFYVLLFYVLPQEGKKALDLSEHTFLYLLIPILFFYKPKGPNRSLISDIVYYALYILAFLLPPALTFMVNGF